jgi:hypothetical protein
LNNHPPKGEAINESQCKAQAVIICGFPPIFTIKHIAEVGKWQENDGCSISSSKGMWRFVASIVCCGKRSNISGTGITIPAIPFY